MRAARIEPGLNLARARRRRTSHLADRLPPVTFSFLVDVADNLEKIETPQTLCNI